MQAKIYIFCPVDFIGVAVNEIETMSRCIF